MSRPYLVCFAVKQEARPAQRLLHCLPDVQVLITGMGAGRAGASIQTAIEKTSPQIVITSGFAGALVAGLPVGALIFDAATTPPGWATLLEALGAKPARFVFAKRVAITAAEKSALHATSGCDAVEMESKVIHEICAARGIECVTLRAISDSAHEDLPLDFNRLMTSDDRLSSSRLALAILRRPWRIPALVRLGRNSAIAAGNLARALSAIVETPR